MFGKEMKRNLEMYERMRGIENQVKENSRAIASLEEEVELLKDENFELRKENAKIIEENKKLNERLKKIEDALGL